MSDENSFVPLMKYDNTKMRRFEGILSEEREDFLNTIMNMTSDERKEYCKRHPESLQDNSSEIRQVNLTAAEIAKQIGYVDMTDFFVSHGLNPNDLLTCPIEPNGRNG